MGLLAFPAMLRRASRCRPARSPRVVPRHPDPASVLLIVYGATAGVSVVQLYAGAFFPGFMLAALYVVYVIVVAKLKPYLAAAAGERAQALLTVARYCFPRRGRNALAGLAGRSGAALVGEPAGRLWQLFVRCSVACIVAALGLMYRGATALSTRAGCGPREAAADAAIPADVRHGRRPDRRQDGTASRSPRLRSARERRPARDAPGHLANRRRGMSATAGEKPSATAARPARLPAPMWFWIVLAIAAAIAAIIYALWTWERLEVFKMLLASFFPLAILILAVLGSIVFGLATPTEAAAVGRLRRLRARRGLPLHTTPLTRLGAGATVSDLGTIAKESSFLTAKTSAMVCWLFVGSSIFSAAFALLGGQESSTSWVLSMDLDAAPVHDPRAVHHLHPRLAAGVDGDHRHLHADLHPAARHFNIDPLFFGLLVALNLQTAFLSPPVAMAAFYLKGVAPPHVTLNQIFGGMLPFMGIQVVA